MGKFSRSTLSFLLLCILVIVQFQSAVEEGGQNDAQNQPDHPYIPKTLMDTISLLKRSHKNYWEKIKTVIHDLQMQFSPPNLEGGDEAGSGGGMKDAVGKSFDQSKETMEESARSAAEMVGEAIHKTGEKVKESDSKKESDAEL